MGLLDNLVEIPKRDLSIIFLVDASESMGESNISFVNYALANLGSVLYGLYHVNPDISIHFDILEMSDSPRWTRYDFNNYVWKRIEVKGQLRLGLGFDMLERELRMHHRFRFSFKPIISLLASNGSMDEWKFSLKKLWINPIFKDSIKIAFSIGKENNNMLLEAFTGSKDAVIGTININTIKERIRLIPANKEYLSIHSFYDYNDCRGDLGLMLFMIIATKGKNFLLTSAAYNYLADYQCLGEYKEYGFIFKTIQHEVAFKKLIDATSWEPYSSEFCSMLSNKTGICIEKIRYVVNQIGLALGHQIKEILI